MAAADIDPLDLLREELKEEDHENCIQTLQRLHIIALALGPERTRKELMPFLKDYVDQDNDEGQTTVAEQLGNFVPYIGGPEHATMLLPLLEYLCGTEETSIREAAVKSLNVIVKQMIPKDVLLKVFPMIKRLANGDWFTTRVSAAGLFEVTYQLVPEDVQGELRQLFVQLCNDDTPMARKAAFVHLGAFATKINRTHVLAEMMPLLKTLTSDEIDHMRVIGVEACTRYLEVLDGNDAAEHIVPIMEYLHDDLSWKVRAQFCKDLEPLCRHVGPETSEAKLLPLYNRLLQDGDLQVRMAATKVLDKVSLVHRPSGLLEHIAPVLDLLASDPHERVKIAFAVTLGGVSKAFGPDLSVKLILPLVTSLAKDEMPDVRNNMIAHLDEVAAVLGSDVTLNSIVPTLLDLSRDPKWRVRMEVIGRIASLSKTAGKDLYEAKLHSILMAALSDHVYAVREMACSQVSDLVELFGTQWAMDKLLPPALSLFENSTNYLHRMTSILVIGSIADHVAVPVIEKNLLPLTANACRDEVANVRFVAAKTLGRLIPRLEKPVIDNDIRPLLTALAGDPDPDVQYYSDQALRRIPV